MVGEYAHATLECREFLLGGLRGLCDFDDRTQSGGHGRAAHATAIASHPCSSASICGDTSSHFFAAVFVDILAFLVHSTRFPEAVYAALLSFSMSASRAASRAVITWRPFSLT
ncbi:MAG TPA: hypothetical protein VG269_10345, partial [Tepidisphaeraceae bacterium]|nr:hypothetical protein [Tepidisphaeraceae bacterium]